MSSTIVGLFYNSSIETGGTNALTGTRSGTMIEPTPWASNHGTYNVGDTVSLTGTAYSCNTQHTAGASLAADASKWDSLGACAPAPIAAIGTVYTLYFRAMDSVTGLDPVQDSTVNVTFTPPANNQVCQTWNGTFTSSALQLTVPVTGGNQPIYVKQTTGVVSSPVQLLVGALSWQAGTRVAKVGTVTTSTSSASVTLTWTDITGETGYEVDRASDNGFTTNLVHLTTSLAANSTSYINNSANGNAPVNGVAYFYRVRGVSAAGVGAWSDVVSATPINSLVWSDSGLLLAETFTHADTAAGTTVAGVGNWTLHRQSSAITINTASNKLRVAENASSDATYIDCGLGNIADAVAQMRAPSFTNFNFGVRGRMNWNAYNNWTGYTNLYGGNGNGSGIYAYRMYPSGTNLNSYTGASDIPPVNGLMTLAISGTGAHGFAYYQNGIKLGEDSAANPTTGTWGFYCNANAIVTNFLDFDDFVLMKPCPGFSSASAISSSNPIIGAAITNLPSGWYIMYWDGTNYAKSVAGTGAGVTRTDLSGLDFTTGGTSGVTTYFHNGDPGTTYNNAGTLQNGLTATGRYSGAAGSF